MAFIILAAAASFVCFNPTHRDGQSVRCDKNAAPMQLHGIRTPPPVAPCGNKFNCPDDPATLARDHLADLTRGQELICTSVGKALDQDDKPVRTVRCSVNRIDLSCAMIADGMAEKAGKGLDCPPLPDDVRRDAFLARAAESWRDTPPLWHWIPLYLLFVNIVAFAAFWLDKSRAQRALSRVSQAHLLGLTAFGGGIGAVIAQQSLDHMRDVQPFANRLAIILGLQIGAGIGMIGLALL